MSETEANNLKCPYCGKVYKTQKGFDNHECEQMRRFAARDEKHVRLALHLFNEFYLNQMYGKKQIDFETFEKSSYYKAFVKFGKYCVESKVVAPDKFVNWLIKNKIKLDRWASDRNYDRFLIQYLQIEPVADALERAIQYSIRWGEKKKMPSHYMLRYMSDFDLVRSIQNGNLSPWVLMFSKSGPDRLQALALPHQDGVWGYVSPDEWEDIIVKRSDDAAFVRSTLKLAGW